MARGVSEKLLGELPERYSPDWLETMDKRTRIWHAISNRIAALESDLGGADNLSHAKRSIMRRAVFLELLAESEEARFSAGEQLDIGRYTQTLNSMLGAYRVLGVERRQRPIRSLREVMSSPVTEAAPA